MPKNQGSTTFNDVNVEHPLSGYIHIANQLKVVEGNGDGTFTPNEAVTFDQAVKMIVCALGYKLRRSQWAGIEWLCNGCNARRCDKRSYSENKRTN